MSFYFVVLFLMSHDLTTNFVTIADRSRRRSERAFLRSFFLLRVLAARRRAFFVLSQSVQLFYGISIMSNSSTRAWFNLEQQQQQASNKRHDRRHKCRLLAVIVAACTSFIILVALTLTHAEHFDPRYWYGGWSADDDDDDDENPIVRLRAEIHKLNASEIAARFGAIQPTMKTPPHQSKIDHVVVLYMENHAADHFLGCMDLPGFDSVKGHSFPKDPSDPSKGAVEVTCGTADYVCRSGPGYDTFAGKFPPQGGNPHVYPYSNQSDIWSASHGADRTGLTAIRMFSPEQVPIKHALAKSFGVFNKM